MSPNTWEEWGQYVLKTLERLEEKVEVLVVDVAVLKTKMFLWAAGMSILASGVVSFLFNLWITKVNP